MKVYFKEEQRFNQWWIKLIMIIVVIGALVPVYYEAIVQFTTGKPVGKNPMSNEGLLVFTFVVTLVIIGATSMIFFLKMTTIIDESGIHIVFKPFIRHLTIKPGEISNWEVRKYNPVKEYGGWGYRFGRKSGTAYNVSGNIGLQLYLKKGRKILIGTQRPDAIKRAMEKLMFKEENG